MAVTLHLQDGGSRDSVESKLVAVVVPIHQRSLTADEQLSLRHLKIYLGSYDRYVIRPHRTVARLEGFREIFFPDKYFRDTKTYSRLLLSEQFYRSFATYQFILIYQLDALVFSDQLTEWCEKKYDYIGAPWFKSKMIKKYDYPDACGNGGFSLRRVSSFIRVIKRARQPMTKTLLTMLRSILWPRSGRLKSRLRDARRVWQASAAHRTALNEDRFWSFEARKHDPGFSIPQVDVGLKFAFEIAPQYCYKRNSEQLPFGCHAWQRYDRDFWSPFLLKNDLHH